MNCDQNEITVESSSVDDTLDNVWDDSTLIQMYNDAQKKVNEALNDLSLTGSKSKSGKMSSKSICWKVGDFCRTIYSEDQIEYEAKIIAINDVDGICAVRFVGYENEQDTKLSLLKESLGSSHRKNQTLKAVLEGYISSDKDSNIETSTSNIPSSHANVPSNIGPVPSASFESRIRNCCIPPPLPNFNGASQCPSALPSTDDDVLASMLMSWYMAGFQTGIYYQSRHGTKQESKK